MKSSMKAFSIAFPILVLVLCFCDRDSSEILKSQQNEKSECYNDLSKGTAVCLSADEAEIIDAVIESRAKSDSSRSITIISDSMSSCHNLDLNHFKSNDTFPDTLLSLLLRINETNSFIGNCLLPISNDYRYISPVYEKSICDKSNSINCFWTEFYSRFPKSKNGILSFSKIATNPEKTKALAWIMWSYGNLGADGGIASFSKENGKWKILSYVIIIVS